MNIQSTMKELFGGSCYGYCLAYLFAGNRTIKELTRTFLNGWLRGYIDDDGFVSDPLHYVEGLCGEKYRDVSKPKIDSLEQLPSGLYVVEYKVNPESPKSHFVVADVS